MCVNCLIALGIDVHAMPGNSEPVVTVGLHAVDHYEALGTGNHRNCTDPALLTGPVRRIEDVTSLRDLVQLPTAVPRELQRSIWYLHGLSYGHPLALG